MKTSDEGVKLIQSFEGLRLMSYVCPAGVLTIGYGHTQGVNLGDSCTQAWSKWTSLRTSSTRWCPLRLTAG